MTSENPRTLSVGDTVKGRPCVVTVDRITSTLAYGNCQTCEVGHVIAVPRYESGQGPWHPVEEDT